MGFLELRHLNGISEEVRRGAQGDSLQVPGNQVSMRMVMGSGSLLSSHGRGIGIQDALNEDFRGLSQVASGNPGFP